MRNLALSLGCLILSSTCFAQPSYSVTPRGVDLIELGSRSSIALNWGATTTRIQQADNAHLGRVRVLRSIAWRRDRTAAKTATLTPKLDILMAHSDFSKFTNT